MIRLSLLASATMLALGVSSAADAGGRPDLVKQGLAQGNKVWRKANSTLPAN